MLLINMMSSVKSTMQSMRVSGNMVLRYRSRKEIYICALQMGQFVFVKKMIKKCQECRFVCETKCRLKISAKKEPQS